MEIVYQVSDIWNQFQVEILTRQGIKAKEGHNSLHLKEKEYLSVEKFLTEWNIKPFKYPSFSKKELDNATYLSMEGIRDYGYPQPDDDLDYRYQVYSHICPKCGVAETQVNPFYIKGEPKWGKSKIFSLTWELEKLFVEKEFYLEIFKPLGVEYLPVIIHRSGKVAETVVQLKLPVVEEMLDMTGIAYKECPVCSKRRYESVVLDFLPGFKKKIDYPIFLSNEFFGPHYYGGYRRIFVSQEFRSLMTKLKQINPERYIPTR
ncbi:MAG TPA: hypothetical protein PKH79_02305 [Prolixibacteraceae bacterium]|nr:hypothetical protein [Prolixibacteraceae bacterium]